ncbi:ferredoxin [Selenomonas sp.]|uniref:ferredoxin n=1 Tax=Selenomonas sp. TaxID=2053611 RepID=UPI0025F3F307|nr:ferredoxin [Selenomonas sp.]MCI6086380.1 ferredoxin [Selenomonas sp.]MDY3298149.1 ferredoxin [Selenomonas sp.]MDY4415882.1 ferredoxin [Selenomonas sp.]
MMVDNIRVAIENGTFSAEEAAYYIDEIKKITKNFTLKKVTMSRTDAYLDLRYSFNEIPFERIRRIPLGHPHEEKAVNN